MTTPGHNRQQIASLPGSSLLNAELDQTVSALTTFDLGALEAVEERIQVLTARHLATSRESLPELLEKRALLGQLLEATAANLKVLVSVLSLEARTEMQ